MLSAECEGLNGHGASDLQLNCESALKRLSGSLAECGTRACIGPAGTNDPPFWVCLGQGMQPPVVRQKHSYWKRCDFILKHKSYSHGF